MRGVPGTTCVLTAFSWEPGHRQPEPGMFLVTPAGRSAYRILEVRERPRAPGWRMDCVRVDPDEIPEDAAVAVWTWTPRRRRRI